MTEPKHIEWHGGECPVSPETKVKVWFRNGEVNELYRARMWTWKWSSAYPEYDIIAYAIAEQPEAEPQRIEWHGGECPVSAGTKVRVWLRDGQIFEGGASKYSSGYYGDDDWWTNHIIAYAIITPDWSDLGPKMAAALRFYADPANWTDPEQVNRDEMFDSPVNLDDHYGDRARAILAQIGETE